jgi:hypothetical protein
MKTVGRRHEPQVTALASGEALSAGARFSESLSRLAPSTFIPKGIYRYKSHEAANKHQQDCLARGMGLLAAQRSREPIDEPTGDT